MTNDRAAQAYIDDGFLISSEARGSLEEQQYHRVVRKCQEAVELMLKGLLRFLGVDYPKFHDIGNVLEKILKGKGIFSEDEIQQLVEINRTLAMDRALSFYGAEDGTPASVLFTKDDAEEALRECDEVQQLVQRFLDRYERREEDTTVRKKGTTVEEEEQGKEESSRQEGQDNSPEVSER